jgi:tRNA (Thr-GGU) A37 N-methylase
VNGLRPYVDKIMEREPTLRTKSMEVQLRTLITETFRRLETLSHIEIVHGLDEFEEIISKSRFE